MSIISNQQLKNPNTDIRWMIQSAKLFLRTLSQQAWKRRSVYGQGQIFFCFTMAPLHAYNNIIFIVLTSFFFHADILGLCYIKNKMLSFEFIIIPFLFIFFYADQVARTKGVSKISLK